MKKISRRVKASRANGAKSRAPKTPEGKLRSQTHAIRHGLLADCIVLDGEDPETFKTLMAELEDRFAPVDEVELGFIEEMAAAYWRMRRGWTIEAELLNQGLYGWTAENYNERLAAAFTGPEILPKLGLLQRYESRLHRMYQRAQSNLLELRKHKAAQQSTEEPNPIFEQSEEPQTQQAEPLTNIPISSVTRPAPAATAFPVREVPPEPGNQKEKPAA